MEAAEKKAVDHSDMPELQVALDWVRQSPRDGGKLEMIVIRPGTESRQVLESGELSLETGLVGDNWAARGSRSGLDGRALPEAQITLMNARVVQALAKERERWSLAGDQLYVDLDLSQENLSPGDLLFIGTAALEITALPHTGCSKFTERFGHAAIRWVNSNEGKQMRLRGIHARVIQSGTIQVGSEIRVKRERPA